MRIRLRMFSTQSWPGLRKRLPGWRNTWWKGQFKALFTEGKIGVISRIVLYQSTPAAAQKLTFLEEAPLLFMCVLNPAANGFVVDQFSVGGIDDAPAHLARPQTEIDVIECDRQPGFIKASEFFKYFAPHHQAGGGNGAKILRQMLAGEVTRFMASNAINVTGNTANSENDTAMLKSPVGIP